MKRILFLTALMVTSCSTRTTMETGEGKPDGEIGTSFQMSKIEKKAGQVVPSAASGVNLDYAYFKVVYDKISRIPFYTQYTITKADLNGPGDRNKSKFKKDSSLDRLGIKPVTPADYKNSGYDKGHMAPAGDFNRSQKAMDTTFLMTNMVPQKPNLNQKAWRFLETKVRSWICGEEKLTIVTGPIIKPGLKKLKSGVVIPEKFFKAVFDHTPPEKSICFIYSQSDYKDVMKERAMSIDDCEKQIGYELSNDFESQTYDLSLWKAGEC